MYELFSICRAQEVTLVLTVSLGQEDHKENKERREIPDILDTP